MNQFFLTIAKASQWFTQGNKGNPTLVVVLSNLKWGFRVQHLFDMTTEKNAGKLQMQVTDGLQVAVYPNYQHEFLLPTKEVALGYNVTAYTIRLHKKRHSDELIEGKHFLSSVTISNGAKGSSRGTMWTKRGIVRLGFFIKSERAKLFRDWAEDLIIKVDEYKDLFGQITSKPLALPSKRNHNRLTQARLVDILVDVAQIEDTALRLSLIKKLGLCKATN